MKEIKNLRTKHFFFIGLMLLLTQVSYGQIAYGLRGGMNVSNQKFGKIFFDNYDNKIGLYGGVFAQTGAISKRFLRAELNYSQKGATSRNSSIGLVKRRFNYLTFTFFHGFRPIKNLSVLIGPEVGYLTEISDNNDRTFIPKHNYSKWDLALDLGVEYKIFQQLSLETRYSYGFRLLYNQEYLNRLKSAGFRGTNNANRVFSIGLNYKFIK